MSTPPKGWAGFGALQDVKKARAEREKLAAREPEPPKPVAVPVPAPEEARGPEPQGPQPQGPQPQGPQPRGSQDHGSNALPSPRAEPHGDSQPQGPQPQGSRPQGSQPQGPQPQGSQPQGEPPVEWKNGELRIPNWIVFNFYPRLSMDERVVWEELYLWTHGFGENPRHVSQVKIADRLGTDTKRLRRIIARLETKGYVRKFDAKHDGANEARGTLYDVVLPAVVGAPAKGSQPRGSQPQGRQPQGSRPHHEKEEKEDMKAPVAVAPAVDVFQIRTIAARHFEVHRNAPGFDHDRLRQLVEMTLIGEGKTASRELVDEAIRGMVEHP